MKRIFFIGSLALCLWACGNSGNQGGQSDSSSAIPSGNTGRDSHGSEDNGPGTGTGPGTGAGAVGGSSTGTNAGVGGDSTQPDTVNRNQR